MGDLELLLVAMGLAADACAVALAASAVAQSGRWRVGISMALHFGLFQGGMAWLGSVAAARAVGWVARVDHWIAFALLLVVGLHMIREGRDDDEAAPRRLDREAVLLALAVATSLDALAVGFGLTLVDVDIARAAWVIGAVTALLTLIAVEAGRRAGALLGARVQLAGGLVLIGIGLRILLTHLAG